MIQSSNQLAQWLSINQERLISALLNNTSMPPETAESVELLQPSLIDQTIDRLDQALTGSATLQDVLAVLQDNAQLHAFQSSYGMSRSKRIYRLRGSLENDYASCQDWGPLLRQMQEIGIRVDPGFLLGLGGAVGQEVGS